MAQTVICDPGDFISRRDRNLTETAGRHRGDIRRAEGTRQMPFPRKLCRVGLDKESEVVLGQGGLGSEIGRTPRALVTNQFNQMSQQLAGQRIESRLIASTAGIT